MNDHNEHTEKEAENHSTKETPPPVAVPMATPADVPDWLRDETTPVEKEVSPAHIETAPAPIPAPTPDIATPTPTPAAAPVNTTDADIPDWLRGAESEIPEEAPETSPAIETPAVPKVPEAPEAPMEAPEEVKATTDTDEDIPDWLKGADVAQTEAAVEAAPTPETIADAPLSKTPEVTP